MQIAWHESLTFGQLTLGKIIKIVATRCQILRLKCTKFNFGPRPRWGSLQRSPDPIAGLRGPTSKGSGGDWKGREGGGEGRGREGEGRGGEGRKREGEGDPREGEGTRPHPFSPPPLIHISGYAPGYTDSRKHRHLIKLADHHASSKDGFAPIQITSGYSP